MNTKGVASRVGGDGATRSCVDRSAFHLVQAICLPGAGNAARESLKECEQNLLPAIFAEQVKLFLLILHLVSSLSDPSGVIQGPNGSEGKRFMKLLRFLVLISLVISSAAIFFSLQAIRRDPLGSDISKYDLSSPESTLRSINNMATRQDLRAAWQLMKNAFQNDDSPEIKLFLSDAPKISVLKSIEVSNSANPKNNGIIVSFVKFTVSGVDYYTVQYFRKDRSNRFYFGGNFYAFGTKTDQDKALESAIEEFKRTGKII